MKPIILITHKPIPPEDLGIRQSYCLAILQAGGIPVISALAEARDYARICQGVVFTGSGCDIHPGRYGQEPRGAVDWDEALDEMELALFREFSALGKPILGICRGHQLINIALGGTLIQDLPTQAPKTLAHRSQDPGAVACHGVRSAPGSILRALFGEQFSVNSYHHQAVDIPGEGLVPTAVSSDGIIEALEHETMPIWSVQFHPERMLCRYRPEEADMAPLFRRFVDQCAKMP